ncbi:MAG TPA: sulfur carrier protein ThiS [bacterium]|jgi:thiamine biosynthesis protein ThiS
MSEITKIRCTVNGESVEIPSGFQLTDFLESRKIPVAAVVIEHNKNVLPKGKYDNIPLSDGDNLEIVQIIGGG